MGGLKFSLRQCAGRTLISSEIIRGPSTNLIILSPCKILTITMASLYPPSVSHESDRQARGPPGEPAGYGQVAGGYYNVT